MKVTTAILIEKNTEDLCTRIHFLIDYFYMLRSEAIGMDELPGLSLLQMQKE